MCGCCVAVPRPWCVFIILTWLGLTLWNHLQIQLSLTLLPIKVWVTLIKSRKRVFISGWCKPKIKLAIDLMTTGFFYFFLGMSCVLKGHISRRERQKAIWLTNGLGGPVGSICTLSQNVRPVFSFTRDWSVGLLSTSKYPHLAFSVFLL